MIFSKLKENGSWIGVKETKASMNNSMPPCYQAQTICRTSWHSAIRVSHVPKSHYLSIKSKFHPLCISIFANWSVQLWRQHLETGFLSTQFPEKLGLYWAYTLCPRKVVIMSYHFVTPLDMLKSRGLCFIIAITSLLKIGFPDFRTDPVQANSKQFVYLNFEKDYDEASDYTWGAVVGARSNVLMQFCRIE